MGEETDGCQMSPDCLVWLQSGCDPALAGRDPAVLSAIVDVAAMADGSTTRMLQVRRGDPAGLRWGGVAMQLWQDDCTEIVDSRWASWDCWKRGSSFCWSTWFSIPPSARWMTITSSQDNVNIIWALS